MIVCLIRTVKKLETGRGRWDQNGTKDTNMRMNKTILVSTYIFLIFSIQPFLLPVYPLKTANISQMCYSRLQTKGQRKSGLLCIAGAIKDWKNGLTLKKSTWWNILHLINLIYNTSVTDCVWKEPPREAESFRHTDVNHQKYWTIYPLNLLQRTKISLKDWEISTCKDTERLTTRLHGVRVISETKHCRLFKV